MKWEKAEVETHIWINDADMDEGFFCIETNKKQHKLWIERRCEGGILSITPTRASDGEEIGWVYHIKPEYWNYKILQVGARRKRAPQTGAQVRAARKNLAKGREGVRVQ